MFKALTDKRWLTSHLTTGGSYRSVYLHSFIFAMSLAWLVLVYAASCRDGTTKLRYPGKGFVQHGGYITLHLMTPIALTLSLLALERFARILEKPEPHFIRAASGSRQFYELRAQHLASLNLHSSFAVLLGLAVVVGAVCTTLVLLQVISPIDTYGNDVFNAVRYPLGYYVANTYLAFAWIVVYPFSLYLVLHITVSMALLLRDARRLGVLHIDLFHPDNCGGLSDFGTLNLLLTLYYAPIVISLVALAETHIRRYTSLLLPALLLPLVLILQAVIGVMAMYTAVRAEKQRRLLELHDLLSVTLSAPSPDNGGVTGLLLWRHIREVNALPYSDTIRYVQALLPAFSLIVGIVQIKLMQ
jgi:hypothetical protein